MTGWIQDARKARAQYLKQMTQEQRERHDKSVALLREKYASDFARLDRFAKGSARNPEQPAPRGQGIE